MNNPMIFDTNYLEENVLLGDGLSCYLLGRSYFSEENGAICDYNKSVFWYKYGYEKLKDPRCAYGLAICYDEGVDGLDKNSYLSNKLFFEAYDGILDLITKRDPFSMFILGAYYFYGLAGIEKNFEKAFKTINESANYGHIGGIFDVGVFYHDGIGIEKDYQKSKIYLEIAANSGLKKAKKKLLDWEKDFDILKDSPKKAIDTIFR